MSDSSAGCARCAELQAAYDDFQQQSHELEEGLEQELQAAQKQVDTLKQRLEKANTALAAERESSKGAMTQLHSQISTLQAELSKSTALVESLKSVKRSSETVAYDHDEKLRRLEAAAQDAAERADSFAEEAVLLKVSRGGTNQWTGGRGDAASRPPRKCRRSCTGRSGCSKRVEEQQPLLGTLLRLLRPSTTPSCKHCARSWKFCARRKQRSTTTSRR